MCTPCDPAWFLRWMKGQSLGWPPGMGVASEPGTTGNHDCNAAGTSSSKQSPLPRPHTKLKLHTNTALSSLPVRSSSGWEIGRFQAFLTPTSNSYFFNSQSLWPHTRSIQCGLTENDLKWCSVGKASRWPNPLWINDRTARGAEHVSLLQFEDWI